ncbi:MAG: hypothetical protein AABZ02_14880 [Bacteroidota bacterium]
MIKRWCTIVLVLALGVTSVLAQTAPTVGLRENTPTVHAFTNARIVVAPGKIIARGTLVIRNGVIEAVGENVTLPADARVWDFKGSTLYPGLIELSSDIGMPKPPQTQLTSPIDLSAPSAQPEKPKGAAHWNARMQADFNADEEFSPDAKSKIDLRDKHKQLYEKYKQMSEK